MRFFLAARAAVQREDDSQVFKIEPGTQLVVWSDDTIQLFEPHEGGMRPLRFNYKEKVEAGALTEDQLAFFLDLVCTFADLWHKAIGGYEGSKLAVVFEQHPPMKDHEGHRTA